VHHLLIAFALSFAASFAALQRGKDDTAQQVIHAEFSRFACGENGTGLGVGVSDSVILAMVQA
jgi:hypothetical protein